MRRALLIAIILKSLTGFSQVQQFFFVDDVEAVEYLWVEICIGDNGKTVSVDNIIEKTTYKNEDNIQQIINYRKGIDFLPNTKYKNDCFDYVFTIVNQKYDTLKSMDTDCISSFRKGSFRYLNPEYQNVIIKRRKKKQIEISNHSKSVYDIKWLSPCNYELTYLKVKEKKYAYLIGQIINVKIIDILENGNYVYYSNLSDRTYGFGIIEKLK